MANHTSILAVRTSRTVYKDKKICQRSMSRPDQKEALLLKLENVMEFQQSYSKLKDDAIEVLHSICQQIWKTQLWPQEWKRSIFIPVSKKGRMCNWTVALISHASNVMLKISHAKLQHYVNQELAVVQTGFRKGRGNRDQIANICWIIEKAREFQRNIYLCFINYTKAFDCVDHKKTVRISQRDGNTRPSYLSPEKPVRGSRSNSSLYGTTDCFKFGKGVCCHPVCLTYTLSTL